MYAFLLFSLFRAGNIISRVATVTFGRRGLRDVEWVHGLFFFPLVLGKMKLPHAKLGLFCVVEIIYFGKT